MNPLPAPAALERYFLEARTRLLDLAAILDRVDRGGTLEDPRLEKIRQALAVLQGKRGDRAEKIQQIFSLEYDATWEKPKPRF